MDDWNQGARKRQRRAEEAVGGRKEKETRGTSKAIGRTSEEGRRKETEGGRKKERGGREAQEVGRSIASKT